MNGAEHLQQHKHAAGKRERPGERISVLHGADEHAHGDGKYGRQDPAQQQGNPPGGGEAGGGLGQGAKENPFLASQSARRTPPHFRTDWERVGFRCERRREGMFRVHECYNLVRL